MSFFRRLFNNPPGDEPDVAQSGATDGISTDVPPVTKPIADPLETGELVSNLPETEEFANDDVSYQLDQTLPVSNDFDDDEVTLPERDSDSEDSEEQDAVDIPGVTRPLPDADQFIQTSGGHLAFGQASDQGMVRSNNQDSAFSFYFTSETVDEFPDFGVFVVADGMGGHQDGEKASAITARTVATHILNRIYTPLLRGVDMNDPDQPTIVEVMVDSVQKANEAVRDEVVDGGTTLTAVVVRGEAAHIAHVGDSRAYWITAAGHIEKITRDHSVVERLIELGQITREEAEFHEQRNVLYRAIGQNDEVEVEIHRKRLVPGTAMLLCSDGLWNMVSDDEILELVKNTADPREVCEKLVALANAHGGTDNITAILIKTPTN